MPISNSSAGRINTVRTYASTARWVTLPQLAERHGLNVAVGAWIDNNRDSNEAQLKTAIELARTHMNVMARFVATRWPCRAYVPLQGSRDISIAARNAIGQPVGTAEPWHVWLEIPTSRSMRFHRCTPVALTGKVSPLISLLTIPSTSSIVSRRLSKTNRSSSRKSVGRAAVRTHESAVASEANEALFLRRFLKRAEHDHIIYYVMEAFDQPWKAIRKAMSALTGASTTWTASLNSPSRPPSCACPSGTCWPPFQWRWRSWCCLSSLSTALRRCAIAGRSFLALVVYAAATNHRLGVLRLHPTVHDGRERRFGHSPVLGMLGVVLVLLAEAYEWAEAHWVLPPAPGAAGARGWPAAAEGVHSRSGLQRARPTMVIETARCTGPARTIPTSKCLVIDNNTREESVWRPVEAHWCPAG